MKSKEMGGGKLFGAKLDFSNKIKKILKNYGDKKIRAIRIGRRPIDSRVEKAFNIISLGTWDKLRKDYYYDTLFHLFLILTLEDGSVLSLEKNSIVTMSQDDPRCSLPNVDCIELEYPADSITVNELVEKPLTRIGKEKYFIYDPFSANCQIFVSEILNTFGLFTPKAKNFIYQDLGEIVQRLPFYVKWTAKTVTDVDAAVSKITGAGCGCAECASGGCLSCKKCPQKIQKKEKENKKEENKDIQELTDFVLNNIIKTI